MSRVASFAAFADGLDEIDPHDAPTGYPDWDRRPHPSGFAIWDEETGRYLSLQLQPEDAPFWRWRIRSRVGNLGKLTFADALDLLEIDLASLVQIYAAGSNRYAEKMLPPFRSDPHVKRPFVGFIRVVVSHLDVVHAATLSHYGVPPATAHGVPGVTSTGTVILIPPDEVESLDRWESRGQRFGGQCALKVLGQHHEIRYGPGSRRRLADVAAYVYPLSYLPDRMGLPWRLRTVEALDSPLAEATTTEVMDRLGMDSGLYELGTSDALRFSQTKAASWFRFDPQRESRPDATAVIDWRTKWLAERLSKTELLRAQAQKFLAANATADHGLHVLELDEQLGEAPPPLGQSAPWRTSTRSRRARTQRPTGDPVPALARNA